MHTEQHPCKSMQATKARRKNARSIAAANKSIFGQTFLTAKQKWTSPQADLIPKSLFPLPPGPSASYGQIYRVKPGLACPSLSIKVRGLKRVPK